MFFPPTLSIISSCIIIFFAPQTTSKVTCRDATRPLTNDDDFPKSYPCNARDFQIHFVTRKTCNYFVRFTWRFTANRAIKKISIKASETRSRTRTSNQTKKEDIRGILSTGFLSAHTTTAVVYLFTYNSDSENYELRERYFQNEARKGVRVCATYIPIPLSE